MIGTIGSMRPISWFVEKKFGGLKNLENFVLFETKRMREGVDRNETVAVEGGWKIGVSHLFTGVVLLLLSFFVVSCINQFAQIALKVCFGFFIFFLC